MSEATEQESGTRLVRRKSVKEMAARFKGVAVADSPASVKVREEVSKEREMAIKKDLENLLKNPKTAGSTLQDQY